MEVVFLDKLDPGVQIIVLLRQCFKMRALKPSPRDCLLGCLGKLHIQLQDLDSSRS